MLSIAGAFVFVLHWLHEHMVDEGIEKRLSPPREVSLDGQTPGQADEEAYENLPETKDAFLDQSLPTEAAGESRAGEKAGPTSALTRAAFSAPVVFPKSEAEIRVEKIMEEGLGDLYASLPVEAKPVFKAKGEEIAHEIAGMLKDVKLRISRIIRLLREWLLTIPKANRFFLEQEAKIKADKIVELFEAQQEDASKLP